MNSNMRRRAFLRAAGTGLVAGAAGCLDEGSDAAGAPGDGNETGTPTPPMPEFAPDGITNRRVESENAAVTVTYDVAIPAGAYGRRPWSPGNRATASLALFLEERPAETFVFDQRERSRFEAGKEITHLEHFHGTGRVIETRGEITTGDHDLVVDNSGYGEQSPEGEVTGELTLTINVNDLG